MELAAGRGEREEVGEEPAAGRDEREEVAELAAGRDEREEVGAELAAGRDEREEVAELAAGRGEREEVGEEPAAAADQQEEAPDDLEGTGGPRVLGDRTAEEIGDLLFAVVNLARLAGVHPTTALARANRKFEERFQRLEEIAAERGIDLPTAGLEVLDGIWDELKAGEARPADTPGAPTGSAP
ncbi:MAG TPA: hypothetical protein ENO23_02865 [Alphaproteobacteria bacterium]|nr:hypothetical protein [Alphaproteobacteria bacterium]